VKGEDNCKGQGPGDRRSTWFAWYALEILGWIHARSGKLIPLVETILGAPRIVNWLVQGGRLTPIDMLPLSDPTWILRN
jgi:hypothetical protein